MCLNYYFSFAFSAFLLSAANAHSELSASVAINGEMPGAMVSSNLFGAFFEEINYAGEGGLYAEMVRNRSFYDSEKADFWTLVTQGDGKGQMEVDATTPLNDSIPRSLRLTMVSGKGSVGAANSGFWGMSLASGETYNLNFYAKCADGYTNPVDVRLESADGATIYAQSELGGLTKDWQHFSTPLVVSGTDAKARLVVSISNPGMIWLDMVSLFPKQTYHGRTNGLRQDLAGKIADLHPSFLRFPGGNFIESFNVTNAVRWKNTIGNVAQRPGHFNDSWGYQSTDGLGAYEFFQFCEDVGMEPLYGINAGLMLNYNGSADNTVPLDQLGPWVQDALDLIEFANGSTNTAWGARRAAEGHPAPFNLKYLEIGNENGGQMLDERYTRFYDAIKAKYPSIHLITPGNWTGGHPWSRPVELADEHYYDSPATFMSYANKYDNYSRNGPKVFVGEYAVTAGFGTCGNLAAALGEAAFMTGMERNSDVVKLACYAPLFANVNGIQWHPDMIYYDSSRSFCTPSYYVQQMFSKNRGDFVLPTVVKVSTNSDNSVMHGAIGVGSWKTSVEYTNIEVKRDGVTLYKDDFAAQHPVPWSVHNGNWNTAAGIFQQTNQLQTECEAITGDTNWSNYTISLRARKTGGSEGFLVLFNCLDKDNWTWLNIGGWNNTKTAIEQNIGGTKSSLGESVSQGIKDNVWYKIRIVLSGSRIRCYLDGKLIQEASYPSGFFVSSTYARADRQIIVKAVNSCSAPMTAAFHVSGLDSVASQATLIQLTSGNLADENSFARPANVFPMTNIIANTGKDFSVVLPANSLSILRLSASGPEEGAKLLLQLPKKITTGQTASAKACLQKAGSSELVDLTTNAIHSIAYYSENPDIAKVDTSGNVTGITAGLVNIIAQYDSLDLVATQALQIDQASVGLVHRYSFDEVSGNICADSVGGSAWNGILPHGGELSDGHLALSSLDQQYLQLPPGVLSNYTAVTVEAWVSFPKQLQKNSFLFGFGDVNQGEGEHYIFCAPQVGRTAITDGNYAQEQNAIGNFDFSFCQDVHVTAVFNPPEGCIALYTNGVLAGINFNATTPLSLVHDVCNYVGRSLYAVDPYADISLAEFRIYNGALSAAEIAENQKLGPKKLPDVKLSFSQR